MREGGLRAGVLPLSKRDERNGLRKEVANVKRSREKIRIRENEGEKRVCARSYVRKEFSISGGGFFLYSHIYLLYTRTYIYIYVYIYLFLSLCISLLSSSFFLVSPSLLDLFRVKVSISLRQVFPRRIVCAVLVSRANRQTAEE